MKCISDKLWCELEKILPIRKTRVGRPEFDNRATLEGILYVLHTGAQWSMIPKEYGRHTTIHGKFMKWCRMDVFKNIMANAREYYQACNQENNWYAVDTTLKKAPFAKFAGKNPTDRAKNGIKEVMIVDRKGAPLYVHIAPANTHDSKLLDSVVSQMNESKYVRILAADSAFDAKKLYALCKEKNIALIASVNRRRKKDKHVFHAPYRWIVEQTFGILSWFRGLKFCWSKVHESRSAFLELACAHRLFHMA